MRSAIFSSLILFLVSGVGLAGDLASDPNALVYDGTTWCGSTVMSSDGLNATIDYCVYGPGDFSYPGLGYTPTSGEFVYAYQVFVDPNVEVFKFSVGMLESNEANNIGAFTMTDGVAPDVMYFSGTPVDSATWEWTSGLLSGSKSYGLAYSSINAPLWWLGSIQNGGMGAAGIVPSPSDVIPEPATLGLVLVGAIVGGLRRRR
jgi:hypothetical protein